MPKSPDDYQPTEADLDLVIEEAAGKSVTPSDLAVGIASLRQRIAQLEADKAKLLDRMDGGSDETLNEHLATFNKEHALARERLAHYQTQLDQRN